MDSPLKVSIITACYNASKTLGRTMDSVVAQTYQQIEYIVIDGASTDSTADIVRSYGPVVSRFISEADSGIADAWNKGLGLATGELIYLLNADDEIDSQFIEKAVQKYLEQSAPCLLYGNTYYVQSPTQVRFVEGNFSPNRIHYSFGFYHTAVVVPRSVYNTVGTFSTKYRIAIDIDFLIRAYRAAIPFIHFDSHNFMSAGGISDLQGAKGREEYRAILREQGFPQRLEDENKKYALACCKPKGVLRKIIVPLKRVAAHVLLNWAYSLLPSFFLRRKLLASFRVVLGTSSYIHSGCRFFASGNITIGNNSVVNKGCYLDNRRHITIGNNVNISHDSKIYTLGHDYNNPYFVTKGGPVVIEDNAVLFSNVLVMPNVTIHEGAVVLAGAVVVKDVDPYTVVGGNPARVVRMRNPRIAYRLDHHPFLRY